MVLIVLILVNSESSPTPATLHCENNKTDMKNIEIALQNGYNFGTFQVADLYMMNSQFIDR